MTLLDILLKAGLAAGLLVDVLNKAKQELPDLAPQIDDILVSLATAVSTENLVNIAAALPAEIANIAKGNLDPRQHPSDIA
jgi:hypothetical protein